jgi:TolB-like protein/DNA-binding winged helix-turn-helix (wHTH) protein
MCYITPASTPVRGAANGEHRRVARTKGQALDFRFADYEIDLGQHELRRSGEIVPIEPQVFDLLVHLVRNRERTVTKDELLDTIWHGRTVSEAALSSRIKAVRKAVGDNGDAQAIIRTIPKRGFRFVGEVESLAPEATASLAPAAPGSRLDEIEAINGGGAHADGPAARQAEHAAAPAGGRTSIAILPFKNLSDDPEYEYFSYGMMEDLIRLLARNRWLTVISRHSTAALTDRDLDLRQTADMLNVRYLVDGSVRRSSDSLKVSVELVRAADGMQLWADSYNVPLADVFDIQEEMARQVSATVEPELARIEQQLASRKPPNNLDAWECYQRALWHLHAFTSSGFDNAEKFLVRAIAIEPELARAHAALGYVNVQRTLYDDPDARPARLRAALQMARMAVALDDRDCVCHFVLGRALCLLRRNDEATAALDVALELNPSFAQAYFAQGFNLLWSGRAIEAEALLDRAIMLSPRDLHVWSFHHVRAWARFALGELEAAARFAREATRQANVTYRAFATLTAALGSIGRRPDAELAAAELLQRKPDYTCEFARQELFFCHDDAFVERFVAGLRNAGIPASGVGHE